MTAHSQFHAAGTPLPSSCAKGTASASDVPAYSPAELWRQRANAAHTAALAAFRGNPSHRNRQRLKDACLERVKACNRVQEVSE